MNGTIEKAWDFLVENEIASEDTLKIITSINGYNLGTLEDVLYATTGYRTFEQYLGVDDDEFNEDEEDE